MEVRGLSTEAIKYSPALNFGEIFTDVGDSIRVFVGTENLKNNLPPIAERQIFGGQPYSINSDLSAMIVHMGILFKDDKAECFCKSTVCLEPEKENDFSKHDYTIEIEFGLLGVIVTVFADNPLYHYPSKKRYLFRSREEDNNAPFSLNIKEVFLVAGFHKPVIFTDYTKILQHRFTPYGTEAQRSEGEFPYIQNYFTFESCKFLFLEYFVIFFTDQGKLLLRGSDGFNLELFQFDQSENLVLIGPISIQDISFNKTSIRFANYGDFQIASFSVLPKEE